MINFLFGWLTKPEIQITALDKVVGIVEIFVGIFVSLYIIATIQEIKEKIRDKRKNKGDN